MSTVHCYCATTDETSLTSSLQCRDCHKLFHLGCLKTGKPSPFEGDLLFELICDKCSLDGVEVVTRLKLLWTHVVQLTLYNLHILGGGKCGYFRWREHICNFIDKHWTSFFGLSVKKTTRWHGTVAGNLSAGGPRLFLSGFNELNELGWWKLADPRPPTRQEIALALSQGSNRPSKKSTPKKSKSKDVLQYIDVVEPTPRRVKGRFSATVKSEKQAPHEDSLHFSAPLSNFGFDDNTSLLPDEDFPMSPLEVKDLEIDPGAMSPGSAYSLTMDKIISDACGNSRGAVDSEHSDSSLDESEVKVEELSTSLDDTSTEPLKTPPDNQGDEHDTTDKSEDSCVIHMGKYEEKLLLQTLETRLASAVAKNTIAKQLKRKLIVRQLKKERNIPLFDLDAQVCANAETKKFKLDPSLDTNVKHGPVYRVLDRYQVGTTCNHKIKSRKMPFIMRLMGRKEDSQDGVISVFTGRTLKAYIWKDVESKPVKLRLLEEITQHYASKNPAWQPPPSAPISYCYVQAHHISAINALCQEFFWLGIDVSECLQYPDFCCVALYKKVVIGFTIMVPDHKYNEAYISFVFTHPDWRNAGIATFMLTHLIDKCKGKDVTLHVSATSPAVLLYQKLGFKLEEVITDFYEKYFAEDSKECRNAMLLRRIR